MQGMFNGMLGKIQNGKDNEVTADTDFGEISW